MTHSNELSAEVNRQLSLVLFPKGCGIAPISFEIIGLGAKLDEIPQVVVKGHLEPEAMEMERDFITLPVADANKWITQKPNPKYFPSGKLVEMWGYTSGKWDNTKGYAAFLKGDYLIADCCCNPGMSGGPVTIDGVYVACVSGGSEWYPYTDEDNKQKNTTWPARAGRGSRLKANLDMVMERYKKAPK